MEVVFEVCEDICVEFVVKVEGKDSQKSRIFKFILFGIGVGIVVGLIMFVFLGFYDMFVKIY